jgi:hypothetical protein
MEEIDSSSTCGLVFLNLPVIVALRLRVTHIAAKPRTVAASPNTIERISLVETVKFVY